MTLPTLLARSNALYGDRPACSTSDRPDDRLSYTQLYQWQAEVAQWLASEGVGSGDRVALWAGNSIRWVAAFWATTCMGAILVPLLPDFSVSQASTIIRHSGATILLVSEKIFKRNHGNLVHNTAIHILETTPVFQTPARRSGRNGIHTPDNTSTDAAPTDEQQTAVIIYTSGTTGKPKGVMLSHAALTHALPRIPPIHPVSMADVFLSVLPLAHIYEMVVGMLLPLSVGAQVIYLAQQPTPQILITALHSIRPTAMLIVPLIIEKIYHNIIQPRLYKHPLAKYLVRVPLLRHLIYRRTARSLHKVFGGRLQILAIGGAPLDRQTEQFLAEGNFPYTCGYGLTETSSLIFGAPVRRTRIRSVGLPVEGVEFRLDGSSKQHPVGEVVVRWGGNMQGYYREPELTEAALSPDGWLKTGDLGEIHHGYLYLRGRSKTMILGPSGENIYPEEIEAVLNEMEDVIESLVYQENGRIIGKVYFDPTSAASRTESYLRAMRQHLNSRLSKFAHVSKLIEVFTPFDRTATRKIKRQ